MFFLYGELAIALSLAALLQLVRPHLALAVGSWRTRHGARVAMWINGIADFEALSSLACYRYEHSDDPFPEIVSVPVSSNTAGLFEGQQLGHPLLPRATMVRNDVLLGADMQLLVVSGSNMSGKSTLLRTVGINVVLALAGAPVRATSLRLTPLAIGATLRIQDSLQEGRSRFYRKSHASGSSRISRPVPCLCSSCSTKSFTAPIHTIACRARLAFCRASSIAGPSA